MLLPDITHTYNHIVINHAPANQKTLLPPHTRHVQRCHVVELCQVWAQFLGAFVANVVH